MKISRAKSIFIFLSITLTLNACSGNETANVNSSASNTSQPANSKVEIVAQDDIEELGKIIKLPSEPEEATYSEIDLNDKTSEPPASKPNEKKLVAVLKYSNENANQIVAAAGKYSPPAPLDVDAEDWFPPELVAKSRETGDGSLKGVSFSANDFLQSPYINGRLIRINDTNYFVLELTSF